MSALRDLIAKWRAASERMYRTAESGIEVGNSNALQVCADELEAALSEPGLIVHCNHPDEHCDCREAAAVRPTLTDEMIETEARIRQHYTRDGWRDFRNGAEWARSMLFDAPKPTCEHDETQAHTYGREDIGPNGADCPGPVKP